MSLVAVAMMSGAGAVPGAAQTPMTNASPIVQIRPEDRGLVVEVSGDAMYDSNIFRTDKTRTGSVDDIILTAGAIARYARVAGGTSLRAAADASYSRYVDNGDRSRPRLYLTVAADRAFFGRCIVGATGGFLLQQSDFGDINAAVENTQRVTTGSLSVGCPRAAGFYPLAEASFRRTRNDAAFAISDESATSGKIGVGYARPSLGLASAYYRRTSSDRPRLGFTNRIEQAGVTFKRAIVSTISLDADLHYLTARSVGLDEQSFSGLGWIGAIVIRPIPRLSVRVATERSIVNDSLIPAAFAVQSDFSVRGEYSFSPNTRATASGQFGEREFRDDPRVIASPFALDRFSELAVGLERDIGRRVRLKTQLRRFARRTNTNINEYDVTLASLGASIRF